MSTRQDILDYYRQPSAMTSPGKHAALFQDLPNKVEELARIVQRLCIYKSVASEFYSIAIPDERKNESNIRSVEKMLDQLLAIDNHPLTIARSSNKRLVCLCRNFGILLLSMLRAKNIPARLRGGYADYLIPGFYETHWICEYWDAASERWKLVDVQLDEIFREKLKIDFDILDVPRNRFFVAGDAWIKCRTGKAESSNFGYFHAQLGGSWHIAGNLVREIAILNKIETMSWDIWGAQPNREEKIDDDSLIFFDNLAAFSLEPDKSYNELRRIFTEDERLTIPENLFNSILK